MKRLHFALTLSNLGSETHLWFPLPQHASMSDVHFSGGTPDIRKDERYGNASAYFFITKDTFRIDAEFPTDSARSQIAVSQAAGRNDKKIFLAPNRFVVSNDAAAIHISHQLVRGLDSDEEKVRQCFHWVVEYLSYGNPIRGLYSSLQALTDRHVDCGGFSTLLVALLRSIGIPARCVFGWAISSKYGYHAWVEYFDREKSEWIPLDPSVAHLGKRTKLDAGFGFINDERVVFSVGEDLILEGSGITWPTPLLQSPVTVSLDGGGIPVAFTEKLDWKFQLIN